MKARRTLLMALPNKDQLKFHSYQDAKLVMEDIKKRYKGNKESKKVQRILLKQQYENFIASCLKTIDQIFDRLQKLINQLEIQGERNKAELETISMDDLYKNLKIYEPEISRSSNTNQNPQNMAFVSSNSTSSTNEADTTASRVSTAHTQGMSLDMSGRRIGFDKTKVECFNFHKNGHFTRECKASRNQDNRGREYGRTTVPVETPTENALIAQHGIRGYDYSYQVEKETPTNYAFMALTSLGRLQSVEERLMHYKKNEVVFTEKINVLNLKVKLRDKVLAEYTQNLEKLEKERDELKVTLEKLQNSSKCLNTLLNSQVSDKSKAGLGYKEQFPKALLIHPSYWRNTLINQPRDIMKFPYQLQGTTCPKRDLRLIDEHFESESADVSTISSSADKTVDITHKELSPIVEIKTVKPSVEKIEYVNTSKETIKTAESHKPHKHYPRGNKRNWNNLMSYRLGRNFKVINKACYVCGSFEHLQYVCDKKDVRRIRNNSNRLNHKKIANKFTHPHPKRGFVPQAVLTRSVKLNTATTSVNIAVRPVKAAVSQSTINYSRPILERNPQQKEYKEKGVIDSGCSRHMIENKCYLTNFEAFDGGFVSFRDGKRQNFCVDLKSVVPIGGLTCLFAKHTLDESNLWHKRLGHINFKTMNKLVKGNLVRGLPSKIFQNDNSCVACQKGKQHKASYKAKLVNTISKPLHMLHMDLFGPKNVKSLMKKYYCLVITDDFSRFSWVFFLATKGETSRISKTFITGIENQLDYKVKVIRSDNGTKFENSVMTQFWDDKGIKREYSVAITL
nr:putative ribonuclease H-like domain-containing protein [Tanacetum cinerariifolium]